MSSLDNRMGAPRMSAVDAAALLGGGTTTISPESKTPATARETGRPRIAPGENDMHGAN